MSQSPDNPGEQAVDRLSMLMGPTQSNVQAVAIMMVIGAVSGGATALIGVIFAHIHRDSADPWLSGYYQALIRTFWTGLIAFVACIPLIFVFGLGLLGMLAAWLWWVIRSVQILIKVSRGEPLEDPSTMGLLR